MLSEKRQREQFEKTGNSPLAWYISFIQLYTASKLLYDQFSKVDIYSINADNPMPPELMVFGVIKMIRAMALEDLFKAIWLKGYNNLVENGKYQGIPGTNDHDLISIADKVSETIDCKINASERDLLKRLSFSITGGRYPIQKLWEVTRIQSLYGGGKGPPTYWTFPKDEEFFESLILRLKHIFEEDF